jgi:D-alanyl-lipoteichoic acid acyltransferase DltB (MBOAT superfamily)
VLFNSLAYAIFLPLAWIVFWALPVRRRLDWMLIASYVFYASWSVPYAAMIFGLVVANYLFGIVLGRATDRRRMLLATFIAMDLAVLGIFKYYDFFMGSVAVAIDAATGAEIHPAVLGLVLPLGISFFTFEFIHYLVDIYRGDVPVHSFTKFHVFSAFFPTQIAGPIKRFQQFVPSLASLGTFDTALAREGLWLIARGLTKKVLIGDRLAPWVNAGVLAAADGAIGTADAWTTMLAFALQVYFDFSGYTDIARGSAALFGFRIPINFDMPYLATSLADFWRRWHISLSTWLRDYVYFPLGGSRRPMLVVMRNLFITMVVAGLWHGAAWHYAAFGAMWGLGLGVQHVLQKRFSLQPSTALAVGGWAFTMLFYLVSLAFFRCPNFDAAGVMVRAMLGDGTGAGTQSLRASVFVIGTAAALLLTWIASREGWLRALRTSLPAWRPRPVALGAAASLVILIASVAAPTASEVFFYFQF